MTQKPADRQSDDSRIEDLSLMIELQQEIATSTLNLPDLMELVCHRTQLATKAIGAVVEMVEDDHMVYHACTGSLAFARGLRLEIDSSISGKAILSDEVLYCEDSETDPRVNLEACRRVQARSLICVPLRHRNQPVGVLKVISNQPHFFKEREISFLRMTAGLLSASIAQAAANADRSAAIFSLQENEKKFRTLFETASEGILISKDGITVEANPAFCKLWGYEPHEIVGKPIIEYVQADHRQFVSNYIQEGHLKPYQATAVRKDGSWFIYEGCGKTIELNHELTRVTTLRDITEQKKYEEALRKSEYQSREAARVKAEFLANMSHEIRTPINGIMGMAGLILDTDLTSLQRKYMEIIKSSADTLLTLINDILDFSKIEANKLTLEKIDFDLPQVVEDIYQILNVSAQNKKLNFSFSISPLLPQYLKGDPTRLRQILSNLANNAIKFTETGSVQIQVQLVKSDGTEVEVRFAVTDTGIGISKEAIDRMFKPFSQVDASTTRKYGGTGLGLSICRQLVEMMDGKIGVISEEGKGSTFWFTLRMPIAEKKIESKSSPAKMIMNQKLRVLIAEDNSVNQIIASKMIEKMGHTATVVANGFEALEALKIAPYDLILMDCQMPELDGYETSQKIRQEKNAPWNQIPIIAITANAMSGDKEKCLQAGMNDYVTKPMKYDDLLAVIERVSIKEKKAS